MKKAKHLAAADRLEEQKRIRRIVRIIMTVVILLMLAAVIAELIVLKNMTSVDRRFIREAERGVVEGWESGKADLQLRDQGTVTDTTFIDKELEAVEIFRNKPYQDKELKQLAKRYVNDLRKCKAAARMHDPQPDKDSFWAEFGAPYCDRMMVLRALYTGDYKMGSSWDEFPEQRDEVMLRGWAVEKARSIRFERTEGEDGVYKFSARLKNDSGVDIAYLNLDVELYDSNDSVAETAEVINENIKDGSEATLVFYYSGAELSSYRVTYADCTSEVKE